MAQFRDFYFTLFAGEDFNVIEGTIEEFLDWTFEDEESFTKEEKLELLDDLIADIEAYKQKI